MNDEIMEESWQARGDQNEPEDDNDGLASEEENLERVSNLNDVMEKTIKEGILDGTILSAAYDTAATSSCGKHGDPFIPTGRKSTKVFQTPIGHKAPASEIRLLDHDLRSPATEVHMMPELTETTRIGAAKLAEAEYVSIFDNDEVNVYLTHNTVIKVSRSAVLRGYKCPQTRLWRTSLTKNPITERTNLNTDTVIVDKCPTEYLPASPPQQKPSSMSLS